MPKTLFDHRKEFLHIRYVSIYNFMADEGHVPPGGTSDASNPDWNAQIAQEEQLRRQEAAIKAAEDGEKDYPSASVGSVADKGAWLTKAMYHPGAHQMPPIPTGTPRLLKKSNFVAKRLLLKRPKMAKKTIHRHLLAL